MICHITNHNHLLFVICYLNSILQLKKNNIHQEIIRHLKNNLIEDLQIVTL